uniref:PCP204L n=1 Tax=African swine fever virus TaxID=10497 RepID=A0A6G7KTR2_ASF
MYLRYKLIFFLQVYCPCFLPPLFLLPLQGFHVWFVYSYVLYYPCYNQVPFHIVQYVAQSFVQAYTAWSLYVPPMGALAQTMFQRRMCIHYFHYHFFHVCFPMLLWIPSPLQTTHAESYSILLVPVVQYTLALHIYEQTSQYHTYQYCAMFLYRSYQFYHYCYSQQKTNYTSYPHATQLVQMFLYPFCRCPPFSWIYLQYNPFNFKIIK